MFERLEVASYEGDIVRNDSSNDEVLYYASVSLVNKDKVELYYGGPNVCAVLDKRTAEGLLDALMQLLYNDLTKEE